MKKTITIGEFVIKCYTFSADDKMSEIVKFIFQDKEGYELGENAITINTMKFHENSLFDIKMAGEFSEKYDTEFWGELREITKDIEDDTVKSLLPIAYYEFLTLLKKKNLSM